MSETRLSRFVNWDIVFSARSNLHTDPSGCCSNVAMCFWEFMLPSTKASDPTPRYGKQLADHNFQTSCWRLTNMVDALGLPHLSSPLNHLTTSRRIDHYFIAETFWFSLVFTVKCSLLPQSVFLSLHLKIHNVVPDDSLSVSHRT